MSINQQNKNNKQLSAKSMDYSEPLDFSIVFCSKKFKGMVPLNKKQATSKYGVLGLNRLPGSSSF